MFRSTASKIRAKTGPPRTSPRRGWSAPEPQDGTTTRPSEATADNDATMQRHGPGPVRLVRHGSWASSATCNGWRCSVARKRSSSIGCCSLSPRHSPAARASARRSMRGAGRSSGSGGGTRRRRCSILDEVVPGWSRHALPSVGRCGHARGPSVSRGAVSLAVCIDREADGAVVSDAHGGDCGWWSGHVPVRRRGRVDIGPVDAAGAWYPGSGCDGPLEPAPLIRLGISPTTVDTVVISARRKLGCAHADPGRVAGGDPVTAAPPLVVVRDARERTTHAAAWAALGWAVFDGFDLPEGSGACASATSLRR